MPSAIFIIGCVLAVHIVIPLVLIVATVCAKMLTAPSFRYQPVVMCEPLLTTQSPSRPMSRGING